VLDSASTTAGSQYTYVRNTGYWNAQAFPFDKFVIKVLTEPSAVLNALLSGQIDAGPMSTVKDATTAANGGMKIAKWRNGDMEALWLFDKQGKTVPALADVRVRQAINYALDRTSIVKAGYGDLATPTDQLFAIDTDNGIYDPALEARYAYDPSKAKKLLADAGYSNGLDITMPDTSTWAPEVVAAIVQNLKDVGIRVTLDPAPADQIYSMVLEGRWAIHWQPYDTNRPWDTTQYQLKKDAPWNMTHYEDPKVTELIGKIQRATGDDQIALFRELNTYLVDIAWAAPINATVMEYAYSPRVEVTPQAFSKRPPLYDYKPAAG
jgi:peptide/nickel transport system substrate-binding protein